MRILLTDIVFPNKYAKWRLVEIYSFMEYFETDILVINRVDKYINNLNFDYNELCEFFKLKDYNILIFNPTYNYINQYNIDFNGIKYNNTVNSCYLIRHKKFADQQFSLNDYDRVYHIFLMNYLNFNSKFRFPLEKQFIHLYPGGGLIDKNSLKNLNPIPKLITTQHFINSFLNEHKITNTTLSLFGGPFYYKNEKIKLKDYDKKHFTICFTSLGHIEEKGADKYIELVNLFLEKYGNVFNIKFLSIGNCPTNKNIVKLEPMSQHSLSEFYLNNVDILINLDSGKGLNGFPLGIESVMQGCLLLTTDVHNSNILNNFNFDSFIIIDRNKLEEIADKIKFLYDNRDICKEKSIKLQNRIYELFNYENHMKKILDFVESN